MAAPKIFITGATGYIGGDALYALHEAHPEYSYTALVRNSDKGGLVAAQYPNIRLVYGGLDDADIIEKEAAEADIVLHTADSSDHVVSAQAIAKGLSSNPKKPVYWIHTSGTGILCWADTASKTYGEPPSQPAYDDLAGVHELTHLPDQAWHRNVDKIVLATSSDKVKTAIICPPMIYGPGRGPGNKKSQQLYLLARKTLETGRPVQLGRGLTEWNIVHIRDVSDLFVRIVEAAVSNPKENDAELWNENGYFLAESGLKTWGEMAKLVGDEAYKQGYIKDKEAKVYTADEITALKGTLTWGFNSRGKARRARELLGWVPKGRSVEEEIAGIVDGEAEAVGVRVGYAEKAAGTRE